MDVPILKRPFTLHPSFAQAGAAKGDSNKCYRSSPQKRNANFASRLNQQVRRYLCGLRNRNHRLRRPLKWRERSSNAHSFACNGKGNPRAAEEAARKAYDVANAVRNAIAGAELPQQKANGSAD